ncbi:Rieske Fe-S protein [Actinopolyspora biskrensis]|uniref:Cytochrome bc1 complex Rieske iron-sulfur subunit n=1 Tax=Actinopolyspora biskrensis TaxID=1470178 RepID=A0A852YWU7_9ACTN|nr:Rieske (2Fe-2S) protein [Actinopolyspora biskrensis]NYH79584.1 Rieske Fe-S protein [Actinopolyspora biskrensis]
MDVERSTTRRRALAVGGACAGLVVSGGCADDSYQGSSLTSTERPDPSGEQPPEAGKRLARMSEVPVGGSLIVDGPEEKIALSRPQEGEVTAHSAVCTHMGCTVEAAGDQLRCPCHGSVFESSSGEVVSGPARDPLPSVPVRTEAGNILTGGS